MAEVPIKTGIFLENEEERVFYALGAESSYACPNQRYKEQIKDDLEETGGGSEGGGITLSIEQLNAYLLASFNKERRQRLDGQRKFGPCPFSEDPNSLLGKKKKGCGFGESPQMHPLLAHSQQFSGDDPKITANPIENPKAIERYPELRLENQLRKDLGLARRKSVTLTR